MDDAMRGDGYPPHGKELERNEERKRGRDERRKKRNKFRSLDSSIHILHSKGPKQQGTCEREREGMHVMVVVTGDGRKEKEMEKEDGRIEREEMGVGRQSRGWMVRGDLRWLRHRRTMRFQMGSERREER